LGGRDKPALLLIKPDKIGPTDIRINLGLSKRSKEESKFEFASKHYRNKGLTQRRQLEQEIRLPARLRGGFPPLSELSEGICKED